MRKPVISHPEDLTPPDPADNPDDWAIYGKNAKHDLAERARAALGKQNPIKSDSEKQKPLDE